MHYQAACVLIIKDYKILAVSRKNNPIQFGLPGGKVHPGETPRDAAWRELLEETGYRVNPEKLMLFFVDKSDDRYTCYTFVLADKLGTPEPIDNSETGVVRWVDSKTLLDGPFGEYNRKLLDELFSCYTEINN